MNRPLDRLSPKGARRRQALVVGATLVGGALVVGCSPADILALGAPHDFGAFGPFIRIGPDGWVTVVSKHIEFGQGSHAGLAAIVAEELDADWSKVKVAFAPANAKVYSNAAMGVQGTGGSSAIANSWTQLRNAGASARAMFVQAAAAKWNVPPGELTVQNGVVSHARSGKQAAFAGLLADAAKVKPPQAPKLKDPKAFTLIGTAKVRRKDSGLKSTGAAIYTQDVHLPNMLTAMVAHAPKFGAKVASVDDAAARKVPGVVDVFQIPTGVAVVAQDTWAARQGRDALQVKWDETAAETRGSDQLRQTYADLAAGKAQPTGKAGWQPFHAKGAAANAGGGAPAVPAVPAVEITYDFPYLAHAAMEPMNCVAIVKGQSCHLIHGSQSPTLDQLNAAKIVGNLPG
ncbi:MAG TPA: molybdopterin cofactor-binding domain-containing protein, partial [Phenylobacterium sp.]|nr:molybdopterin cofactor-binding domain-containing protein [Phenylobacterium sp.]